MLTNGFFEVKGSRDELLPKLCSTTLKKHGVAYFADFGDGDIKVGMTRDAKARLKLFDKTTASYGKYQVVRFGFSPILANHELVEKQIHKQLSEYWIGRELFRTTEEIVGEVTKRVLMDVLRSCMWPSCKGYFNYYGKDSVRPK